MNEFLDIVRALGVAGGPVFAVLWWLERIDRKAAQIEARESLIKLLNVTNQAATSITEITEIVSEVSRRINDMTILLTSLANRVNSRRG